MAPTQGARRARVARHVLKEARPLAKASITMAPADLWRAWLAIKPLHHELREAIAEVAES